MVFLGTVPRRSSWAPVTTGLPSICGAAGQQSSFDQGSSGKSSIRFVTESAVTSYCRRGRLGKRCDAEYCRHLRCILAEMASGRVLFPGISEIDMLFKIFQLCSTPTEETFPGISNLSNFPNYKDNFPRWTRPRFEVFLKSELKKRIE